MKPATKCLEEIFLRDINLKSNRFGFEPEFTAKIAKLILEFMNYQFHTMVEHIKMEKITWRDGIAAIYHILYFNMSPKLFLMITCVFIFLLLLIL